MNARSSGQLLRKQAISVIIITVGILILLGLNHGSWLAASQNASPEAKPMVRTMHRRQPDYMKDPAAAASYVEKLALQSHGDITKLPADDQTFLYGMVPHYAPMMLRERYQALISKRQTPASHPSSHHAKNSGRGTVVGDPKS